MAQTLQRAGGYRITQGTQVARNFKAHQRKPWIASTRSFIKRKLRSNDWATKLLVAEAERNLGHFEPYSQLRMGKHGTPLQRAQDIIGNIITQGKRPVLPTDFGKKRQRFTAVDVLITALAVDCMVKHWEGTPLRSYTDAWRRPYFRAVQIGRAIHAMQRADCKSYTLEDGHGLQREVIRKRKRGLTSRYVSQRLQQLTEAIYGSYKADHGRAIASLVARSQFMKARRSDYRTFPASRA